MTNNGSKTIDIDGPLTSQAVSCTLHTSGMQRKINSAFMSTNPAVRKAAMEAQDRIQGAITTLEEELRQARNSFDKLSTPRNNRIKAKPRKGKQSDEKPSKNNAPSKPALKSSVEA